MNIHSYDELENLLRNYTSWGNGAYDTVGIIHLALACLDNLRANTSATGLDIFPECLNPEQGTYFLYLAKLVENHKPDSDE